MLINPKVADTSHYDQINNPDMILGFGIRGIINKATEGPGMVDKTFATRRAWLAKAGLKYGAYHFLRPGNMQAQASHFLDTVGDPTGLLLALDHEDPKVPLSDAKAWLQIVHDKVGRWPVLYSGFLIKEQVGTHTDALLTQVKLWLAQYSAAPSWPTAIWKAPWLWQYTGDGAGLPPHNVPGITLQGSKGIDVNSYAGTDEQLAAEWAA